MAEVSRRRDERNRQLVGTVFPWRARAALLLRLRPATGG